MLPSLNGLRAFEAAARHLSFTRAAAELNVTQTAISHQIRRLEEQLGKRLFVRRNRALALTREAEDYLPAVRAAFEDLRRATARLQRPEREGLLTVSTTASLAAKWLVTRVASFQEAHPGIEVRITTSAHLVDFQREEVDMAVRYGRGNWPGLRAQWLMAEDIFPVCSPALMNGAKPLRRPEDLAHQLAAHHRRARGLAALAHRRGPAGLARGAARPEFRSELHGAAGGDGRARRGAGPQRASSMPTSPPAGWSCRSTWCCRRMPATTSSRRRRPPTRRRSPCSATGSSARWRRARTRSA